ncbi:MAG: hypothetical protein IPM79_30460 [Polyangiaceae bacterium]|jgi:hypothetical protein|nr:hypothetical protein [Polyangiaceae bacterium]MBK8941808.1 hypothetical protein [Polyangiaceae bacterium]
MMNLGTILRDVPGAGMLAVSDELVVGSTLHEAVLLDQAVSDALGSESWAVRRQAAFDASFALVGAITRRLGIEGDREILDLATELFATLGLGQLRFDVSATGGEVMGTDLLFGGGFLERQAGGRGTLLRHHTDAFAAGFVAAAASIAYPSDWGSFEADETRCVAKGDSLCLFSLARRPLTFQPGEGLSRGDAERLLGPDAPPHAETTGAGKTTRDIISSCVASDRGTIRISECRFALVPASYRAQLTYDTMHLLEKRGQSSPRPHAPRLGGIFMDLAREASRAGMFHLVGSLFECAPLRDAFGDPPDDPNERVEQLTAISSALGWGPISVLEHTPKERLVLGATITPEAVYYAARHGGTPQSRLPGLQGLAEAIYLLTNEVDWSNAAVDVDLYRRIALDGPDLVVEETRSILSGDRECEVAVQLRPRH